MYSERNSIQVPEGWQGGGDSVALLLPKSEFIDSATPPTAIVACAIAASASVAWECQGLSRRTSHTEECISGQIFQSAWREKSAAETRGVNHGLAALSDQEAESVTLPRLSGTERPQNWPRRLTAASIRRRAGSRCPSSRPWSKEQRSFGASSGF